MLYTGSAQASLLYRTTLPNADFVHKYTHTSTVQ